MAQFNPARSEVQRNIDIAKELTARKSPEAPQKWRFALESSIRLLGPAHDVTAFCYGSTGQSLVDNGQFSTAIALLEDALRQTQAIYGYVHFNVERICQALARAYKGVDDNASAHKHWMTAATSSEALRGLNHNTTIFCLHQAARTLACQHRFEDALPVFKKVHDATVDVHGNNVHVAYACRDLATCYNQLGRFEEALPFWKKAHKIFSKDERREVAASTLRTMFWTRDKVRSIKRAAQLEQLKAMDINETVAAQIADMGFTQKELDTVLAYLKATYLTGDNGDYPYADSLRMAYKSRFSQVHTYHEIKRGGCCGDEDVELEVENDDGRKVTILVGFNFGH